MNSERKIRIFKISFLYFELILKYRQTFTVIMKIQLIMMKISNNILFLDKHKRSNIRSKRS